MAETAENGSVLQSPKESGQHIEPSNEIVKNHNNVDDELSPNKEKDAQQTGDVAAGSIFQVFVRLPHEPFRVPTMISNEEQVQDLRQLIVELPSTFQYTCFHLEHDGKRINDYISLSDVPSLKPGSEIVLIEDPYTEKEARVHMLRVRELLGIAGDRPDLLYGICAGATLHDEFAASDGVMEDGKTVKQTEGSKANALHGYDLETPATFEAIVPLLDKPIQKLVKSLSLSPWHPPPHHLRQKGHLLYLQVTTNEGEQFQITSHVAGFYVNKCSNNKFDPSPKQNSKPMKAHSLLTLISLISPSFDSAFSALQSANSNKDPLTLFQPTNAIPASPWIVPSLSNQAMTHQSDLTRVQEPALISGIEISETLRDWNEEFQSTKELAAESIQDRVFRERLIAKLFADYNEVASRGAVLVARGEVAPLNPTEGLDAQIFIYNNIFFSFGADGVGTFVTDGGDEASRVAVGKDVLGVKAVNQLDIPGLFTPGTVVVDYLGKRLVGQSIVPGIFKQRDPGEHQIDYGGVEGKEVVADNEAFVQVFEKLSGALRIKKHPVWDKDGQRHELEGSVETKGLLGTDGRKYVLDLYRVTPLDVNWIEENWKDQKNGVAESTAEHITESYPHRMSVLRPELIDVYWRLKRAEFVTEKLKSRQRENDDQSKKEDQVPVEAATQTEKDTSKSEDKEASKANAPDTADDDKDKDVVDISDFHLAFNPDVFSGQRPTTEEDRERLAQDEKDVRELCNYLVTTIIPDVIQSLKNGDVGFPMDGQSLSRLIHKRGINVRYLGKIAQLATPDDFRLNALRIIAVQEMISRAFKHIANRYLRYLPAVFAPSCLSHLLNCFLGVSVNPNPKPEVDDSLRSLYSDADFSFEAVTPENLFKDIAYEVRRRYRYILDKDWISRIKRLQMLREVALKLGLQLENKSYPFDAKDVNHVNGNTTPTNGNSTPGSNGTAEPAGGKKKKRTRDTSPTSSVSDTTKPALTFHPDDILNIVPIIKDSSPKSPLAEEALEAGRISILQERKDLGLDLLLESLTLHEQVYGVLHPEVARLYHQLSMLYYQLEEKGPAVELANKAVIISERMLGVDSAETILGYLNLALFEHANGNTQGALSYMKHSLDLWKVIYGIHHPDIITSLNNAAVMLQHIKRYHESRLWFDASLAMCEEAYGKQSINAATILFQLAQALALDQDSKGAVNRMREAYTIFLNKLGPEDRNTKEAENWLDQLTQNAVSIAKHAKDLQARKLRRMQLLHPGITLKAHTQPQVGQPTDERVGSQGKDNTPILDSRSIDELLKFIEGDGGSSKQKRPTPSNPKRRLH